MADFHVKVHKITQPVINHPNADRLTIVSIGGYQCIANKHDDGSWRYHEGDYIVYIPEGALVPEWLLRQLDICGMKRTAKVCWPGHAEIV